MKFSGIASLALAASVHGAIRAGIYGIDDSTAFIYQYTNGTYVELSKPLPNELQAQQLSAIDSKNGIYYLLGYDDKASQTNLLGIDMSTGSIVSNADIPLITGDFVGVGQLIAVEPETGLIIAGGQIVVNGSQTIGWLNPKTGKFAVITELPAEYLPLMGSTAVYDPLTTSLIFQLGTEANTFIFSVNVSDGSTTEWAENFQAGQDLDTMDYDVKTGLIYGLGVKAVGSALVRTLVAMNPRTQTFETVNSVQTYTVENGSIAALDSDKRILYWQALNSSDPTGSFYLVGLSLKDASVVSASPICNSDEVGCPWSLEYFAA